MEQILKANLIKLKISDKNVCYKTYLNKYNEQELLDKIALCISKSASILVLYNNGLPDEKFLLLTEKIKMLCAEFDAALFVYKRADITFLSDVDGIYLDKNCLNSHQVTHILGSDKLICYEDKEVEPVEIHADFSSDGTSIIVNNKRIQIKEL